MDEPLNAPSSRNSANVPDRIFPSVIYFLDHLSDGFKSPRHGDEIGDLAYTVDIGTLNKSLMDTRPGAFKNGFGWLPGHQGLVLIAAAAYYSRRYIPQWRGLSTAGEG